MMVINGIRDQICNRQYVVVFHLDTGLMIVDGIYDNAISACGDALLCLQRYADEHEDYDDADMYFTTIYSLEGDTGFGMSLMLHGSSTENGIDRELADVWILIKEE